MVSERIQRRIDALLDEADEAASRKDWPAVADAARRALALDPDSEDARAYLGMAELDEVGAPAAGTEPAHPPVAAPREPSLPSSFVSGRYRVIRLLGEGGRKRVFLAHDSRLDREVALAHVRVEGLQPQDAARAVREAQAMGRMGAHPHLVAVFDVGEERGAPFIVEEYMSGGDASSLLEGGPPPVERTIAVASDVCRALSYLHARDIVHRDLKPANVFLAQDGTAKVGDFGLAIAPDRTRLTMAGSLVGTASYMPPEQALGGAVTPRSDLYALGAMLYELVTGRPPFVGDEPTSVISQHINNRPVAPSWHTEQCPPALEDLILSLLEKDPSARPESADAVLRALSAIDPSAKSRSHSDSNALDRLARGVFVGREAEMAKLRSAFDDAFAGRGSIVMLAGEPGIGKTRTAQEVETYARMRGADVFWGRTFETAGAPPYYPWIQVGRAYAAAHGIADIQAELNSTQGELVRLFPELRQQPGFVEPGEVDDPEYARFRLLDAYATFMRAVAGRSPTVLILDDLHWADGPSLKLLQHLSRELSNMRLLVVGTYRDTDLVRTHPLSETLAALNREGGFERIPLRGLSEAEVAGYIRSVRRGEPPADLVGRIYRDTEGNPFFLAEVVNLMAAEGTLDRDTLTDVRLPEGVREALGRRLDRLSEDANDLLKVAAMVGRQFAYDTLALVTDYDDDRLLHLIEEGLGGRVIEEADRPGRYRFTHALMQETLLEELSTTRRVRLHGRIGEAIEQRYGDRAVEQAHILARHFVESAALNREHAGKALAYSRVAAERAMASRAWEEAVEHFEHALEQVEAAGGLEPADEGRLYADYATSLDAQGADRAAWRAFRRAYDRLAETGQVDRLVDLMLLFSIATYASTTQARLLEQAITLVPADSREESLLRSCLGVSRFWIGDPAAASEQLEIALRLAERVGDLRAEMRAVAAMAQFEGYHYREHSGQSLGHRWAELAEALQDWRQLSFAHWAMADPEGLFPGDLEAANMHADRALEAAVRARHSNSLASAWFMKAIIALTTCDWAGTREAAEQARRVQPLDPRAPSTEALAELHVGNVERAGELLDYLRDRLANAPAGPGVAATATAVCCGTAARVTGDLTQGDVADRAVDNAMQSGFPPTPFFLASLLAGRAEAAVARDDADACRDIYDRLSERSLYSLLSLDWGYQGEHWMGMLAAVMGELDTAIRHYENARAVGGTDFPLEYSWACYEIARTLHRRGGPSDDDRAGAELRQATELASRYGMGPLLERCVALRLQLQGVSSTDSQSSIHTIAASVGAERPNLVRDAAPDGTVTLMFSDIVDSTALNERLGDTAWMALLREHAAIVEREVAVHGGHVVKSLGDGFMVAFPSAREGLRCAVALQRAFDSRNLGASQPIEARIGLHTGEAVRDQGDFFGRHVNLAARIAASAGGGEVVVSSSLAELVGNGGEFTMEERPAVSLKGLEGTHVTCLVAWH